MPTYEEIFGPTYETPIENYPEDYLNKRIVYPIRKGKESETRFGQQPKNRIDQIVEEPARINKTQNELSAEEAQTRKESITLQNTEAVAKTRIQLDLIADQVARTKKTATTPVTITKTGKSGDNII